MPKLKGRHRRRRRRRATATHRLKQYRASRSVREGGIAVTSQTECMLAVIAIERADLNVRTADPLRGWSSRGRTRRVSARPLGKIANYNAGKTAYRLASPLSPLHSLPSPPRGNYIRVKFRARGRNTRTHEARAGVQGGEGNGKPRENGKLGGEYVDGC